MIRAAYLLLLLAFPIVRAVDHNAQFTDATNNEYSDKEMIRGLEDLLDAANDDIEDDIEVDRVGNNESATTLDSSSMSGSSTQDAVSFTLATEATTLPTMEESTQFTDATDQENSKSDIVRWIGNVLGTLLESMIASPTVKKRSSTLNPSTMTDATGSSTMLPTTEESTTFALTSRESINSTATAEEIHILDIEIASSTSKEPKTTSTTLESGGTTLDSSSMTVGSTQDAVSSTLAKETTLPTIEESTQFTDVTNQEKSEQEMTMAVKRSTSPDPTTWSDAPESSTRVFTTEEVTTLAPIGQESTNSTAVAEEFSISDLPRTSLTSEEPKTASITLEPVDADATSEDSSFKLTSTLPSTTKNVTTGKSMPTTEDKLIVVPEATSCTFQESSTISSSTVASASQDPSTTLPSVTDAIASSTQEVVSTTLMVTEEFTTLAFSTNEPTTSTSATKESLILDIVSTPSTTVTVSTTLETTKKTDVSTMEPSTSKLMSTTEEMLVVVPEVTSSTSQNPATTMKGFTTMEMTPMTDVKRTSSQNAVSTMDASTLPTTVESTTSALSTQEPKTSSSGTSLILGLRNIYSKTSDMTKITDVLTWESVTVEASTLSSTESGAKASSSSSSTPSTLWPAPGVTDGFTKGEINSTTPASEGDDVDQQKNVGVESTSDPNGKENNRTLFIIGLIISLLITIVAVIFLALVVTGKICAPPSAEKTEEI
ncbi:hypothetical protein L596_017780 [Steinernema carpocapsae]|uniref:SEA domain-containing protein n=1 Tax=Steinernema carpocapsae TaxID=34508 RepID=A0A4U5N2W9_STECR|nr:hypothetical protein L596_017780 [Steinernema carpocapsae]